MIVVLVVVVVVVVVESISLPSYLCKSAFKVLEASAKDSPQGTTTA